MKITYLHQYFNTPDMSGSTRSYEMARRLVMMGHEVNLITSLRAKDSRRNWFQTTEAGISVHWLPVPYSNSMGYLERMKAFFSFAILSAQRAALIDTDVVFASSTPLTIALPAVYSSRKQKVPLVFEVRDLWPEMPIAVGALKNPFLIYAAKKLESWAYGNSSAIVALSPGMKKGVLKSFAQSSRVCVIPNGSDTSDFACNYHDAFVFRTSRDWLLDKPLLLYAGAFGLINGVEYLVHLARALLDIDSDIRILLVGSGREYDQIIRLSCGVGVLNRNLFIESPIPKCDVPAMFSAATMISNLVIDLPQARINSANKFFDALAAGKPVFLNHGGWMRDLIVDYSCGISAWRTPLDEVATELDKCMHDCNWLATSGRSALNLAQLYFDRNILSSQLEQVLVSTVEGMPELAESIAPGDY
jgi:glycosyltransferase involved in cell wall biosynthesis